MPFGVVLDCGSSGTRLHVFHWTDAGGSVSEIVTDNAQRMKLEPGISSFAANPAALATPFCGFNAMSEAYGRWAVRCCPGLQPRPTRPHSDSHACWWP